jgi:methionyl-tRNA formyltransferase
MRLVVVGAVSFTRRCVQELKAAGGDVVGVFGLSPEYSARHGDYVDLKQTADQLGLKHYGFSNINAPETISAMRELRPDVIFVLGLSQLLGKELLSIAPCIGSHPALLPRDRGRHPITWALVDGRETSGLTFLWLAEGADTGDLLWQRPFPIGRDDDAADLLAKIEDLAAVAIHEFLPQLERGEAARTPQNESRATVRRKRTDADRWVDWTGGAETVHNLVRGLARPYVGALTRRSGQDVSVWKTRLATEEMPARIRAAVPGTVAAVVGGWAVRTGDGHVLVLESDPELDDGDVLASPV